MPNDCLHGSWECYGGWHTCNDCREALGTRLEMRLPHEAEDCGICAPGSVWTTKDSGQRFTFESGMQRDTQEGKARFDLLFPLDVPYDTQFLTRVAELLARGAEKYDERNWEQAEGMVEMRRFQASAARHFAQWMSGEQDEDHAAAVVFNLLGAETLKWKMDQNEDPSR